MKKIKEDHSPLDSAVFAVLNSTMYGTLFSLSMFNKKFEPYKYNLKEKVGFTFRNIAAISIMYGLNQFLVKFFQKREIQYKIRNYTQIKNDKVIHVSTNIISTIIPAFLSYQMYYYKNKNPLIDKPFFILCACMLFILDFLNYFKNNKKII